MSVRPVYTVVSRPELVWQIERKKWLLRRSRPFKVTYVGTNRKPVCDLPFMIITSNTDMIISYLVPVRRWQIIVQISDEKRSLRFGALPLWGWGFEVTYSWLIGKLVDFLFVFRLIQLFC